MSTWIRVATHTATHTGATVNHCGMTAPVYQLEELPRTGERGCMTYNLAALPDGRLAHVGTYPKRRRALEISGVVVGWVGRA